MMKLTPTQIDRVLEQFCGEVVPLDSPSLSELETAFGPHTFFVGPDGLHFVERSPSSNSIRHPAFVVRVAAWWDEGRTTLLPHDPEVVVAVDLGGGGAAGAAG